MNWDDLRIIAAIRAHGTYAAAGTRLHMDETTVARRIARLQAALGITLFNAADGIRKPTASCEAILAHVHAISRHVAAIGDVANAVPGAVGRFRIATTNTVAEEILSTRLDGFLADNPGLTLQFVTSDANVNFSRWEADFAIRLRKPDRGDFTITRLANMRLYLFEPAAPVEDPVICTYSDMLDGSPETRHLMALGMHHRARCITENLRVARTLIAAGRASGILPEHLCADLHDNPRVRATELPVHKDTWLLVQNHLRRDPAARAVIAWIRDAFAPLGERRPTATAE